MGIREFLLTAVSEENLQEQVSMKEYTTFRAGGPARWFVTPQNEQELAAVLAVCRTHEVPYLVLGRGSNLLIGDGGFDGAVLSMRKGFDQVTIDRDAGVMDVQAGVMMPTAAAKALEAGFEGLEFASGIPGTIGGGILMNAGAYGGELGQILIDVTVLDPDGTVRTVTAEEAALSYRHSAFIGSGMVILSCRLQLTPCDRLSIRAKMDDFNGRRREKQPLEFASAGSTFKRPAGHFAGKLIEDAGLKGYSVGDAQVSEKHAGFVINRGNASAAEIRAVCEHVAQTVKEIHGVELELEVQLAGIFK
ncbi:MAG: UDP-N-acetylmuramate dehydrogenase [Lachnospiraceae bacterium]|nr:UDP-N-acetylmuramate dehydrogenase [Lachnospiraceae bacterium]